MAWIVSVSTFFGLATTNDAHGDAADHDELRDVQQHHRMAAGNHEATERGRQNNDVSDDD